MLKIASIAAYFSGIGFGIPCIYGIWHFLKGKGIATVMGFPAFGNGPFEKIGVHTNSLLLTAFLLICILECVSGQMLLRADKGGAILSLAILPAELVFFIGFALPFGPPLAILRSLLVLLSWSALSQS